jgi:hypothetical protein
MQQVSERTLKLLARRRADAPVKVTDLTWTSPKAPELGGLVIVGVRMTFRQYLSVVSNVVFASAVFAFICAVISAAIAALFKGLL